MQFRTDMADERRDLYRKANRLEEEIAGIECEEEERYGNMFLLRNDGDSADVIFLYQSIDDALVADVHYIKSSSYSGYVHCCGRGCPACAKGIRIQNKLFIPLYNISANEVQFFDRSIRFENVLNNAVFSRFPNPSEFVFRITRHGAAGSMDTTYDISAVFLQIITYHFLQDTAVFAKNLQFRK